MRECGCRIDFTEKWEGATHYTAKIIFCDLHDSAGRLLYAAREALEDLVCKDGYETDARPDTKCSTRSLLRVAIRLAEKPEQMPEPKEV